MKKIQKIAFVISSIVGMHLHGAQPAQATAQPFAATVSMPAGTAEMMLRVSWAQALESLAESERQREALTRQLNAQGALLHNTQNDLMALTRQRLNLEAKNKKQQDEYAARVRQLTAQKQKDAVTLRQLTQLQAQKDVRIAELEQECLRRIAERDALGAVVASLRSPQLVQPVTTAAAAARPDTTTTRVPAQQLYQQAGTYGHPTLPVAVAEVATAAVVSPPDLSRASRWDGMSQYQQHPMCRGGRQ